VVVPAVGVVIGDDDRRARPVRGLLQRVDLVDDELLLVDRVGVGGVAVLVAGRLEEADCREQVRAELSAAMPDTSLSNVLMSYWWLAVSKLGLPLVYVWVSCPTACSDVGATWCGLAVEA
jgi:hypothetical protein